jgi:predicted kinase
MIHLIVGNTGSGKTTYSKSLKKDANGILFSIDNWNKTLFLMDKSDSDGLEWFLERIERSEKMIMELILQLEASNVDSILDLGLSKLVHRNKFRAFAKEKNLKIKMHFLNVPKNIRKGRVTKRNTEQGETFEFVVSDQDFEFMENWFETPTDAELTNAVVIEN